MPLLTDKESLGMAAILLGWLAWIIRSARKAGNYESRFNDIEETVDEHTKELAELKSHHDDDMRKIMDFFSTSAGGQKFITFPDHDVICDRNNKAIITALTIQTEALKRNTEVVEALGNKIHIMDVDIAVLKERRVTGQRQGRGIE